MKSDHIPFEWITKIMATIACSQQHTYLILTKRTERMLEYFLSHMSPPGSYHLYDVANHMGIVPDHPNRFFSLPLPNLWVGCTVENQKQADERIPILLQVPAAKRFISYEPALGPLNIEKYLRCEGCGYTQKDKNIQMDHGLCRNPTGTIDWVVAGCQSGAKRRPAKIEWFRNLKDQCEAAGVPFFLKQMAFDVWGGKNKVFKMPNAIEGKIWDQTPGEIGTILKAE